MTNTTSSLNLTLATGVCRRPALLFAFSDEWISSSGLFRIMDKAVTEYSRGPSGTKFKFGRITKMKLFRVVSMFVAALVLSTSAFGQDLPSTKVLTFDVAEMLAHEAMAVCRA